MASFEFWQKWLLAVCGIFIIFGLVVALLSWSPLFTVVNSVVNDVFWHGAGPDAGVIEYKLWIHGVLGGTIAGWGVTLWFVVNGPFIKGEKWSRDAIVAGLAVWFLVDTSISVYTNAYFNVYFNVLSLILVSLPLAMTWRKFSEN